MPDGFSYHTGMTYEEALQVIHRHCKLNKLADVLSFKGAFSSFEITIAIMEVSASQSKNDYHRRSTSGDLTFYPALIGTILTPKARERHVKLVVCVPFLGLGATLLCYIPLTTEDRTLQAILSRCNRPEYTPGRNIPGVKAA